MLEFPSSLYFLILPWHMGYVNCNSIFCWSRKFVALYKKKYKALYATLLWTHLSMNKDHRAQEPPRPSLSIHVQHAQDLEEADAPATHATSAPSSVCLFHSNWAFLFIYLFYCQKKNKKQKPTGAIAAIPDGRCGKHLAVGPDAEHNDWGDDHNQIWGMQRKMQLNTHK